MAADLLKYIELKLAVLSVTLIAFGFFLFPIVAEWLHTADRELAGIVAFLFGVAFMVVGGAFGIAIVGVLIIRLVHR